ncbi:MAG: response regulator transcription factor [Dehalococcoidales bacterium]|nr:response regulator transcription factor [Dehalococcoidales bacterium]
MSQKKDTPTQENASIVLGHPYALLREGIARILSDAGFKILKQVDSELGLYQAVTELHPEIILIDTGILPHGIDSVSKLNEKLAGIVVVLTTPSGKGESPDALKAGATGFLSVTQSYEQFIQAITLLAKGDVVISSEVSEYLQEKIDVKIKSGPAFCLTERERDVATLIAKGATNREIASNLMVSHHTVKIHLHNILTKLDLKNRQQIAAYAIKQGLTEDINTESFS